MTFNLKHLSLALLLAGLPLASVVQAKPEAAAQQSAGVTVLASLPVTYGLGSLLLDGTTVKLQRAAPANIRPAASRRTSAVVAGKACRRLRARPMR